MSKVIAILATLDTKAREAQFMKQEIEALGGAGLIIDVGVVGEAGISADVSRSKVIAAGGGSLEELLVDPSREKANPFVSAGAAKILQELQQDGKIDGVVALGGTQGT